MEIFSLFHVWNIVKSCPFLVAANTSYSTRKWAKFHGLLDRRSHLNPTEVNKSFTGSQYHGIVDIGRDIWRSSCPTPLQKQGHLETVVQNHVEMAFEYFWGRLHSLSGQLVPMLGHPHSKKVSWCSDITSYFNLCSLPVVFSLGTSEKSSALFAPSLQVLIYFKIPRGFSSLW